jgi:ferredoxin
MSTFEHHEAHHNGACAPDCPVCAIEEMNRLAELRRREALADPDAYFIAPDQLNRPALWRISDDIDNPTLVVRRDQWADAAAWELLEVGVRVAQAVAS